MLSKQLNLWPHRDTILYASNQLYTKCGTYARLISGKFDSHMQQLSVIHVAARTVILLRRK